MENKKYLLDLHDEIRNWRKLVQGVKEETERLNRELEAIVMGRPARESLPEIEHFQNQLIRQSEVSDEIGHELKLIDLRISRDLLNGPTRNGYKLVAEDTFLRDKIFTYDRLFRDLRAQFNEFAVSQLQD